MMDWIKKHKFLICIAAVLLLIGVPIMVHVLYKLKSDISWLQAEWTAGEFLQYYAAILTLIPTTLLSFAALNYTVSTRMDDDKWKKRVIAEISDINNILFQISQVNNDYCRIDIQFENSRDNYPEFAVLSKMIVDINHTMETIEIPCYRKSFCCVQNKNKNKFDVNINIYEYHQSVLEKNILDKIIRDYSKGLITRQEIKK